MMQISPETQLFIREHSSDDVRVLALQAKKYPDIDMPTAITQIAGNICRWSNALLKSPPATKHVFCREIL